MKQIILSEEEARILVLVLKNEWIKLDYQAIIYNLVNRIEKELEIG